MTSGTFDLQKSDISEPFSDLNKLSTQCGEFAMRADFSFIHAVSVWCPQCKPSHKCRGSYNTPHLIRSVNPITWEEPCKGMGEAADNAQQNDTSGGVSLVAGPQ